MVGREIERREIVEIVFDFRTGTDPESRVTEDALDTSHRTRNGMPAANVVTASWQRDVDGVLLEFFLESRSLERLAAVVDATDEILLGFVDRLAGGRAFLGRQLAQGFEANRQLAFLAEVANPHRIERRQVNCRVDLRRGSCNQFVKCLHQLEPRE